MYRALTDNEVELLVQSFSLPPPAGFTEAEKKEIINWIKSPSIFLKLAETRREK